MADPEPNGPAPGQASQAALGPGAVVLLAFLHFLAFILIFGLGASLAKGGIALVLNASVASLVAPLGALYVGLARWAPSESTAAAVGLRRVPGGPRRVATVLLFALILGAALAPLASELTARIFAALPMPPLDPEDKAELLDTEHMSAVTGMLVFACLLVLAPMVEELLYRGFMQSRLKWRGRDGGDGGVRGALFIAVIYAAVQINPRFFPAAFLLALALALAVRSGGSTWVSIVVHVAHRAAPFVLAVFVDVPLPDYIGAGEYDLFLPPELTLSCAAIAALAAFALWRLRVRD